MIMAIANQKGGSGKTTTASAIISGATLRGKKALGVDLDAQGSLTYLLAGTPGGARELLENGKADIQHTKQGDIIGGDMSLAAMDSTLRGDKRIYALKDALDPLKSIYDVIVVDCPPSLGTLLINALTASDGVIIPMRAKMTNVQGLILLADTIRKAQLRYNHALYAIGVLLTEHNGRTIAARTVTDTIRETAERWNIPVLNTAIRQGVAVDEAQIVRESLFTYAPKSNPATDYAAFLDEIGV